MQNKTPESLQRPARPSGTRPQERLWRILSQSAWLPPCCCSCASCFCLSPLLSFPDAQEALLPNTHWAPSLTSFQVLAQMPPFQWGLFLTTLFKLYPAHLTSSTPAHPVSLACFSPLHGPYHLVICYIIYSDCHLVFTAVSQMPRSAPSAQ